MLLSPVTTIVPKLRGSPMENGDAGRTSLAARAVDQDLLLCGIGQVSSMEMERHQRLLRGTLRIHRVTTQLGGLRQWRMQKDLGHLLPGCGTRAHVYCPVMRGKVGNGANGRGNDSRKDIQ